MSKQILKLGLAAVLVIVVLAVYVIGRGSTRPQVSVSPTANLADGQSVSVRLSGFGPGNTVRLSECATDASANDLGCGTELAAQTATVTGSDGSGSVTFTVRPQAAAGPLHTGAIEACSDQCVIVATLGPGTTFATAPITFEAP